MPVPADQTPLSDLGLLQLVNATSVCGRVPADRASLQDLGLLLHVLPTGTVQDLYNFQLFQMVLHCWLMINLLTMFEKEPTDACFISPKHLFSSPHQTLQFGQTFYFR